MPSPIFTKRHYERIASILGKRYHSANGSEATNELFSTTNAFIHEFKRDNPRFDADKFWNWIRENKH